MAALLEHLVVARGEHSALIDERGTTTWALFAERVDRLINGLAAAGIGPGDTLVVMTGNRSEAFEVFWAAAHLGFTYVPVNWHWVADELAYVLEDAAATALVVDDRLADIAVAALEDPRAESIALALVACGPRSHSDSPFLEAGADIPVQAGISPPGMSRHGELVDYESFLAAAEPDADGHHTMGGPMFYTSGTTGRPKGVRGILAGGPGVASELLQLISAGMNDYVPTSGVTLLAGPIYHSAQWAFSMMPMVTGSSVVLQHRFDPTETLGLIDRHAVTNVHLVPTQFKRLLDVDDALRADFAGTSLEAVWHGAAPCPPPWKRAMIDWLGPVVHEYYGSTEGAFISRITAEEWTRRGGSVGRPLDTVEVMVIDDADRPVQQGEPGTLYFKSLLGVDFEYHNAPEKTAEAHRESGVFTTGDIGYLDDDGYLWLSDRKIDMIISGGVNIYPAEIESILAEHPDVADVAVIGVPDDEFGEQVKAIIEVRDGADPNDWLDQELTELCRDRLAGYKRPKSYDRVETLPRTGTGKVLKRTLRAPYWEGTGRSI